MNRTETALAALLFSVVIAAPAAAQQAPLTPPPAVSEFCSGCFAYLEFPPLPDEAAPFRLGVRATGDAPVHHSQPGERIGALKPSLVSSSRP